MASTLNVIKQLTNEGWVISANISAGGTLPREIFVYENTGTTQLGEYQSVIAVLDISRIQIWTGSILPVFGNKYVRHHTGTFTVQNNADPDAVIASLKASVQRLSTDYQALASSSQAFTIT